MKVLAGDVGGTHARLAVFEGEDEETLSPVRSETLDSGAHSGLVPIVREFLSDGEGSPDAACVAVAGPVRNGVVQLTNLGWELDVRSFADEIGVPGATIINDFDAIAYGIFRLDDRDVEVLQEGEPRPRAPMAIIGAGTGLGQGYLTWHDGRYRIHSSEGGHADFPARTPLEAELRAHLRRIHGHVSSERVVSGPGLQAVYEFLRDTGQAEEREEVRRQIGAGDGPAVISRWGRAGTDELSRRALNLFVSAFGALAGNLALTVLAEGGVWVAGGVAPEIVDALRDGPFMESFRAKGRMRDLMERIPVKVVLNEEVGLLGAASAAALNASGPSTRATPRAAGPPG